MCGIKRLEGILHQMSTLLERLLLTAGKSDETFSVSDSMYTDHVGVEDNGLV